MSRSELNKRALAAERAAFARDEHDVGSSEVQIANLTMRIKFMTEHLQVHKKDKHSRRTYGHARASEEAFKVPPSNQRRQARGYYFTTRFEGSIFRRRQVRLVRFELNTQIYEFTSSSRAPRTACATSARLAPGPVPETRRGSSSSNVTPRPRDHARRATRDRRGGRGLRAHVTRDVFVRVLPSSRVVRVGGARVGVARARVDR